MVFKTYAERVGERRGYKKGLLKGKLESQRESVLQLLEIRFNKVPKRIVVKVSELTNSALLDELLKAAFRCTSLKEFESLLPEK